MSEESRKRRGVQDREVERFDAIRCRGVAVDIARMIMLHPKAHNMPIEDAAELVVLEHLIRECDVDPRSRVEMGLARKQAKYARKLRVFTGYLVRNLRRNLRRLDVRREGGRRRGSPRPHYSLGTLTQAQRARAEYIWDHGANHGLSFADALRIRSRENPAVYRRVHRVLHEVMST